METKKQRSKPLFPVFKFGLWDILISPFMCLIALLKNKRICKFNSTKIEVTIEPSSSRKKKLMRHYLHYCTLFKFFEITTFFRGFDFNTVIFSKENDPHKD